MIARPVTAKPTPQGLRRGNFELCHGCTNARHLEHTPANCDCDLCAEETP